MTVVHSLDQIALRFPESLSLENYVAFTPNLTVAQEGLTICGWLKKSRENTGSYAVSGAGAWFNYGVIGKTSAHSNEILLMDSMREVYMFGASGGASGVRANLNTWQHNCLVWTGPDTKSLQAYVDGDLKIDLNYYTLEERRLLSQEGAIVLGQHRQSSGRMRRTGSFGGDMHQLNLFHKVLTAEEVGSIYQKGVCGEVPKNLQDGVLLDWSDFLGADRFGAVHTVKMDCSRWNRLRSFIGSQVTDGLIEYLKEFHDEK